MKKTINLMARGARLDPELYSEAYASSETLRYSAASVLLSGLAAGIAGIHFRGPAALLIVTFSTLLRWVIVSYFIYLIGAKVFRRGAGISYPGVLRAAGFSYAPGVIRIAGLAPQFYFLVFLAGGAWMFTALSAAVMHSMGFKNLWKSAGVCILGWALMAAVYILFTAAVRWM